MGTIKENMKFANMNATDKDIEIALNKANALFVKKLEQGINKFIGTSSLNNLSGGKK